VVQIQKYRGSVLILAMAACSVVLPHKSVGQDQATGAQTRAERSLPADCVEKDIRDLFKGEGKRKKERKSMLLVLPNVSSNPANGLLIGVAGTAGFYLGPRESTKVSSTGFNMAFTTKNQFLSFIKSNVYTKDDRFFLQGDWRFFVYNAPTWGLGTNAPDTIETDNNFIWQGAPVDETGGGFQMAYNYLKFHEIVNYEVGVHKYIGLGYHLDYYYNIQDRSLQLDTLPLQLTPHYLYSRLYEFNTSKYLLSGISLNFIYDSRDNLINPYTGHYVHAQYRYNPTFLGSDENSSSLWLEYRTYLSLSENKPRHLIGFWFFGSIQVSGRQPYLTLMALGEDQRARSGRGYIAGRYRGEDLLYSEIEYRFPISKCSGILGGVLFVNATTASSDARNVSLFDYVKPGAGAGIRIMLNKDFRTNINMDFGVGSQSQGFYFSGTETF
jgi:outer membrane protein assembly factor BamA